MVAVSVIASVAGASVGSSVGASVGAAAGSGVLVAGAAAGAAVGSARLRPQAATASATITSTLRTIKSLRVMDGSPFAIFFVREVSTMNLSHGATGLDFKPPIENYKAVRQRKSTGVNHWVSE